MAGAQLSTLRTALHEETHLYSDVETTRAMGLGLTLTKEYLHLHGGDVAIEHSTFGEGTTVVLTLPANRVKVVKERTLTLAAHSTY
jgi:light-regulated signal transduction histidine kinase (bacteriophytochrome)